MNDMAHELGIYEEMKADAKADYEGELAAEKAEAEGELFGGLEAETAKQATYNAYDKRVSLHLAMLSATVAQNPMLLAALQKLPELGWDLYKLEQKDIEVIYAEFDSELETKVKAEFEADPDFLIDLGHAEGTCPLCGHEGCRYLFRIQNNAGGQSVECGSECIIIHGLHVKGAETAEHARKALETAIRRQLRKLVIQKWHKDYDFKAEHFDSLRDALNRIRQDYSPKVQGFQRTSAYYKLRDLAKLRKFYDRNGWLGTEKRWTEWSRLAKFARMLDSAANASIPFPLAWLGVNPEKVKGPDPLPEAPAATPAPAPVAPAAAAPVAPPAPKPAPAAPVAPAPAQAPQDPFAKLAAALVFGPQEVK